RRRTPHIEEVLAHPLVPRLSALAGSQVRQAMLHLDPLAQLRPPCPCCRAPAQALLEGLVHRNAHRAAVAQGRRRALRPQRAAVTRRGRKFDHHPETKEFCVPARTRQGLLAQIELEGLLLNTAPGPTVQGRQRTAPPALSTAGMTGLLR